MLAKLSNISQPASKVCFLCPSHVTVHNSWCCQFPYFLKSLSLNFQDTTVFWFPSFVFLFWILFKCITPWFFIWSCSLLSLANVIIRCQQTFIIFVVLRPVSRQTTVPKVKQSVCQKLLDARDRNWKESTRHLSFGQLQQIPILASEISLPPSSISSLWPFLLRKIWYFSFEKSWQTALVCAKMFKFLKLKQNDHMRWSKPPCWSHFQRTTTFHDSNLCTCWALARKPCPCSPL